MMEKLKTYLADDAIFYSLLILLVGITAFGLGRQSVHENEVLSNKPLIEVLKPPQLQANLNRETPENTDSTMVVASKSGARYHLPSCPGAKQIKDSNLIEFTSIAEAEAAGYTPAANCPGLP